MEKKNKIEIERIKEALKNGEYKIITDRTCDCSIDHIDNGGIVISGNDCWRTADLIIDGVSVYTDTQYDGVADSYDIRNMLDDMGIIVSCGYREWEPGHTDDEIAQMIISHYEQRDDLSYYVYYPRGFANEYTVIVRPAATSEDDIDDDWDVCTLSDWAELAANSGDPATTMCKGFDILD